MDTIVFTALEQICSQGAAGLTLPHLYTKLTTPHLHLCPNLKQALWTSLLTIPTLRFQFSKGGSFLDCGDVRIRGVEEAEKMEVKIVAVECLVNSFVGIYDIVASDAGVSERQRKVLERLAIARTDGITQNDLAKALGIKNNDIFYVLKGLESRGLIVRQSTIIRKKEAGNEGEYKSGSIVNTNMLHLYRYAKHLGHLQRLEITKEDKTSIDNENDDKEGATGDGVSEERIADFVPALRAICDRLEKANGKVLVISDLKKELGYRKTPGHRAWRNIVKKLKDAHLVEEFIATEKKLNCLRLLKKFSPETFAPKSHGGGDDDLGTEQHVKLVKRGQVTDQIMELPIEQQIYDMVEAEGAKGLIINEVYKRLGINNKRYYPRILEMVSRFGMHIDSESHNRGVAYRIWTSGNYNKKTSNTPPDNSKDIIDEDLPTPLQVGQLMLTHNIQDSDDQPPKVDDEASVEVNLNATPLDSRNINSPEFHPNYIIPEAEEVPVVNVNPVENNVSLETPSSASPAKRIRRSSLIYPCIGHTSVSSLREQRILEKLQKDKVLIRAELMGMLESLENQDTKMDKKTLERSLNKLQKDGHCKCINFAFPSATNYGRIRAIDVVLHPSVIKAEDLSDRVHEKLRTFEKQTRNQNYRKFKDSKSGSAPVLTNVERIHTNVKDVIQAKTAEAMKNNGFVLAKMVRVKLLHVFLWGYLTKSPGWDDAILGKDGYEHKNPHSTCKFFELDAAIKAMPLELFLQVAGSSETLESMVEKCKEGLCLSDLPKNEYRSLMGTRVTGLISSLIDILRRLKLIRLIGGEPLDAPLVPHTTLRHSIELKPYIEEPVRVYLTSTGVNSFDLRPHVRHDFVLASRKDVDEYWNTLEYCYAASDKKAALHAFPGSVVHETFHPRSWASARVMTAHQRAELSKIVANDDLDKKISYKKCEKIAEKLDLTLEQVLRVYYDKRQKNQIKESAPAKRKRSRKGKPVDNGNSRDEESRKRKHAKISTSESPAEEQNAQHETRMLLINEFDSQKEAVDDDVELTDDENGHSYSAIHECALSKLQYLERNRFTWTEEKDRLLVIEYVKHRVALGAKFSRTDWTSIESLPAPPDTCRRRMSTLNRNEQFKKAVLNLCNMLSVRYVKHLQRSKNKRRIIVYDQNAAAGRIDDNTNDSSEERWDDFEKEDIKMVLDEVLKYKQKAKMGPAKGPLNTSKYRLSDVGGERHELDGNNVGSSTSSINELKKDGRKRQPAGRKSRAFLPKSYVALMNKGKGFGAQAYESLAVSNAIELFKLVFLSTAKGHGVPNLLAETLRRYSEHDLLIAFNYLRDRNFMVRGNDSSHFVLSQQFLHNISSSPFPVNTGEIAIKMAQWLHEKENDLLDMGVNLSPDLQCGDILQLSVLMCSGEISVFPCLPDEGVGEIDDSKKRKSDDSEMHNVETAKNPTLFDREIFSRKEKGFPGIQLSLSCNLVSKVDAIALSRDENSNSLSPVHMERILKSNGASESTWEAMTCYAKHLASHEQETSPFNPNLFKTVYSAIQKAGDQGLSMKGISQIIDVQGEKMPEVIVEVLEAFGRVLKVNAFDSVHVVDSLYRSKYLLASMGSHQQDLDLEVPETHTNDGEPHELQQQNHEDKGKYIMEETCTDPAEVQTSTDEVNHRVTILNHPEEVPLPINEVQPNIEIEATSAQEEKLEFVIDDSRSYKPILPWVNGDGTINEMVYKGLVRRVLGIVMQNPGILEEHVVSELNVLNPQSGRKLLELMILDNHVTVRKMYHQSVSNEPPAMLQCLFGSSFKKPKLVCREHLFANPKSVSYL
ncbi:B-block binding subunit of TFIIIC [Artemisia annua]|uniref:B-block binding subunit of TFIIIC n=1 Tax=Artemisia annua TaxID=35608 RepID=A0A2U1PB19_ARTAN|nr:B-block binding subunit of TFIIIC [Artemisia annua]